ncbi:MAG: orotidine-5'-phosphate decarboxylase [Candidatus Woesebacteria bacterium]
MKFIEKLTSSLDSKESHVCVGLDSRYDRIPEKFKPGNSIAQAILAFNKEVVDVTHDIAVAYKSNVAFYGGFGAQGLEGLELTNAYIQKTHPDIPLFADCKRSEMGESVKMIEHEIFEWLRFDCVMVTPWFGFDTIKDYLEDEAHGVLVYVHDSNPSAAEFQELVLQDGSKVYEAVTTQLAKVWNTNGNVIVESGATYPEALKRVREIVGEDMPILTAGVGIQGGKVTNVSGTFGKNGRRLFVNSSRGIIFAGEGKDDYFSAVRTAAITLRDQLWQARL